ncbi:uncharacterized protein LOC133327893 [Musca vetustissima]|uniref:uncharacterized protein LOC133327893 n=1 Tax=Musca vetustissima TaxID=27455 RepID=UPI002AB6A569|nr:uncharacterized protein LOC133327893 [Musca vetustissima]
MSHPTGERIKVTFDKKELQNRITNFTFREARRHSGNLYAALVQELREDGCLTSAKYFEMLASKETDYYKNNVIRDRVMDHPGFLMSLYDNCKMAERSALLEQCEGMAVTFNLLYQIVSMMDEPKYARKFNWLRKDVYEIVAKICDKLGKGKNNVERPIAMIYLKYAICMFHNKNSLADETINLALLYYEKAITLAQTNKWITNTTTPADARAALTSLHTTIAEHYVAALLKFGKSIAVSDYLQAVGLGQKAICVLTQVGRNVRNLHQFTDIEMHIAEFYIEGEKYDVALALLQELSDEVSKIDNRYSEELTMRLQLNKGICYTKLQYFFFNGVQLHIVQPLEDNEVTLNAKTPDNNHQMPWKSGFKSQPAQIYMEIGKLYLQQGVSQRNMARNAFLKSKEIYESLGDLQNSKKNKYLLAQVMSTEIFPLFMDLMKASDKYCNLFDLRRWKYQLKPFWRDQYLKTEMGDELQCLLNEFPPKKTN